MSDAQVRFVIADVMATHHVQAATPTVEFRGLDDKLVGFVCVAGDVHQLLFECPLIVTSAKDSVHVESSKHGQGKAVDLRTHDLTAVNQERFLAMVNILADRLGLTVFDERNLPGGPHFHVEVAG